MLARFCLIHRALQKGTGEITKGACCCDIMIEIRLKFIRDGVYCSLVISLTGKVVDRKGSVKITQNLGIPDVTSDCAEIEAALRGDFSD